MLLRIFPQLQFTLVSRCLLAHAACSDVLLGVRFHVRPPRCLISGTVLFVELTALTAAAASQTLFCLQHCRRPPDGTMSIFMRAPHRPLLVNCGSASGRNTRLVHVRTFLSRLWFMKEKLQASCFCLLCTNKLLLWALLHARYINEAPGSRSKGRTFLL